jgi:hypothetical protein
LALISSGSHNTEKYDKKHRIYRHKVRNGITKLDKEKNQCIRQKTGAQNIVKEIKQYQEKWLQHVQRMDTDYQNKHYNTNQKEEGT